MEQSLRLPEPRLEFLFRAELELGEAIIPGDTADGGLRIVPFSSGRVEGPGIRGEAIPRGGSVGGDWHVERSDGVGVVDAKYLFRTDDGAVLSIDAEGSSRPPAQRKASADNRSGFPVGTTFRERLFFKSGARKYRWLGDVVVVGTGFVDDAGHKVLDAFVVR